MIEMVLTFFVLLWFAPCFTVPIVIGAILYADAWNKRAASKG